MIQIRQYQLKDYALLKAVYEETGWFDKETDAEKRLANKIQRDPGSILVAVENKEIIGSVSIIEDGRIAFIFRLVAFPDKEYILVDLIKAAKKELSKRKFKEAHVFVLEEDLTRQKLYLGLGFKKGKVYQWMYIEKLNGKS
ncbi:hypothetical protein HY025_04425 [Candidatus Daviesbacteria bacterium]|nr:hypothetical protein [Candidatus Daviesbacteria bacterium]